MQIKGEGWLLHFKNKTVAYADIVIGSDGANSKIRPYITPIPSFYPGISGVLGSILNPQAAVPHIHTLLKDGKIMAFGAGKSFTVATKRRWQYRFLSLLQNK